MNMTPHELASRVQRIRGGGDALLDQLVTSNAPLMPEPEPRHEAHGLLPKPREATTITPREHAPMHVGPGCYPTQELHPAQDVIDGMVRDLGMTVTTAPACRLKTRTPGAVGGA